MSNETKYCGKYRGVVVDNNDPEKRGRLKISVPDVLGQIPTTWAEACTPYAGPTGPAMGMYLVPPVGAGVWVEFEQGDPDYPVWTGCRWGGSSEVPTQAFTGNPSSPNIVLQTLGQHMMVISDLPGKDGGFLLKSASGASLKVSNAGIELRDSLGGSIVIKGKKVSINGNALEIE